MKLHLSHDWRLYEGIFILTVLSFNYGNRTVGVTVLNFAIEIEF